MDALVSDLSRHAEFLGFARLGVAAATEADGFERLRAWLDAGHAGEMAYLHDQFEARRHPRGVYPPVRSVVMAAMTYAPPAVPEGPPAPRIAGYALGVDYHLVVRDKLKLLAGWLKERLPGCWGRICVDSAPLMERDFARRAGLGWFGKNTMLIHPRLGSWFVLGAILTDAELAPSEPFAADHCGTCTACLDLCPTGAFVAPRVLDARECISYLTIELKTPLPEADRPKIGEWLFGCDVCQDVCPWNRKAAGVGDALRPTEATAGLTAEALLGMDATQFAKRFAGTALHPRPGRAVVLRNAAVVLGNVGTAAARPALAAALGDPEEMVREAAAWALREITRREG